MGKQLVDQIEAPGGKVVVIGEHHGPIDMGGRPATLFIGVPPPLQRPLVGRDAELAALRDMVRGGGAVALNGLPGVGKTALATALVYDPAIREHFRGGVLWAGLGPAPDVESALGRWAAALGFELSAKQKESASAHLSVLLQQRARGEPVLLVVDDVWAWEDAMPFEEIYFPGCAHVVTTRDAAIARELARKPTRLGELSEEQALAFLAERCPEAKAADPEGLLELARAVGGLPLGLTLISAALNEHAGHVHWVRKEIARLSAAEARLALEATPALGGATHTLRAIVEMSVEALAPELQRAFEALGAFAPKPADFGREAAFAVWELDEASGDERLRRLVDRALVEVVGGTRFTLHQVPAAVAAARLGEDAGPRARHAGFHAALVLQDRGDLQRIERELEQIRQGFRWSSGEGGDEAIVLRYAGVMRTFFDRRGLWREDLAWLERALEAARRSKWRGAEGMLLTDIGMLCHHDKKDFERGLRCYEEALAIHREMGDRAREGRALTALGCEYRQLGDRGRSLACYEESLAICRELGNRSGEGGNLHNLAMVYLELGGDEKRALGYLEQALSIHRENGNGNRTYEANTLTLFGRYYADKDRVRARRHFEEALQIRRELGDRPKEASELTELARLCFTMGNNDRALEYYNLALPIQREVGDHNGEANTVGALGALYFRAGDTAQARRFCQDAVVTYREVDHRAGEASVIFLLAWLQILEGSFSGALASFEQLMVVVRAMQKDGRDTERAFVRMVRDRLVRYCIVAAGVLAVIAVILWISLKGRS